MPRLGWWRTQIRNPEGMLFLSFLSGAAQRWITRQFAQHARRINVVAGLLLVGIGIYDLWSNWAMIQTFLS